MTTLTDTDFLYSVNKTLQTSPDSTQRDIAAKSGMSLGMTNAVLRRFAAKGWVMMQKLSLRTIRYALTPAGMNALAKRSCRFMQRTFAEMQEYRTAIEARIQQAKEAGCTQVVLYGASDIAFIIEWACSHAGLAFSAVKQSGLVPLPDHTFGIVGEQADQAAAEALQAQGCVSVYVMAGRREELNAKWIN